MYVHEEECIHVCTCYHEKEESLVTSNYLILFSDKKQMLFMVLSLNKLIAQLL